MFERTPRARLHQALAPTLRYFCNDASDSVLIENNGVTPEWVATHFQVTPLFPMSATQSCRRVDADAWCKRTLRNPVLA